MNTIEITANNHVVVGNRPVASVVQTAYGTRVYLLNDGRAINLPSNVYSLASNRPASGVPGRAQFEADFLRALAEQS